MGDYVRRSIIGLLSGAFLSGLLAVAAPIAVAPSAEAATACPRVQLFGVRGSGETVDNYYGYGRTVYSVIQQAKALIGSDGVNASRIDYPAIAVGYGGIQYLSKYDASVEAGKVALKIAIDHFTSGSCGAVSRIAIVGYSQGAHVAGDVYQARLTSAQRDRVIALALIGDPRFKGSAASPPNFGDFSTRLNGVYDISRTTRVFSSDQYSRVRSYCVQEDPVCNFSSTNVAVCKAAGGSCVHSTYFYQDFANKTYTDWAATFLAKQTNTYAPAPALLTSWSRNDPARDVVSWSDQVAPPVVAMPDRTVGDITSVSVDANRTRVRFVFTFRDLPEWNEMYGSGFGVSLTQGDTIVSAGLLDNSTAVLNNGYTDYVCRNQSPGLSVNPTTKQIIISISDRCLEDMRYFRFFSYAYSNTADGRMYFDDAVRTGFAESGLAAYSPVVHRW